MKIHYIMDPLCGWSYGVVPHITQLHRAFKGRVEFNVIPAGQWAGNKSRRLEQKEIEQLREENLRVTDISGAQFGQAYESTLAGGMTLDSGTPSRAIVTFQTLLPDRSIEFASAIQTAYFQDGKDLNATDTYKEICQSLRVDTGAFLETFRLPYLFQMTRDSFRMAEIYAKSYPSFWFESKESFYLVKQGYATYNELAEALEKLLSAKEAGTHLYGSAFAACFARVRELTWPPAGVGPKPAGAY